MSNVRSELSYEYNRLIKSTMKEWAIRLENIQEHINQPELLEPIIIEMRMFSGE